MMEDTRGVKWTGNPECKNCDGLFWIDMFEMKDGQKIKKIENVIDIYGKDNDDYQSFIKDSYTIPCPVCKDDMKLKESDEENNYSK